MSFLRKKQSWVSQTLIYMITLEYSLSWVKCFEKVTHEGWLEVPIILSSSSDIELGIVCIKDHRNFWIKTISNSFLFSKIISISSLFFWTFYKKTFRFFKIMNLSLSRSLTVDFILFFLFHFYFTFLFFFF